MKKISNIYIQKLAKDIKIVLNNNQINLLKIEFENIIFPRLKIIKKFNLENLKPLKYLNIKSVSNLREDIILNNLNDVGEKNLIFKSKRLKKEKLNLYLISKIK